jgi:hypothetical protein
MHGRKIKIKIKNPMNSTEIIGERKLFCKQEIVLFRNMPHV